MAGHAIFDGHNDTLLRLYLAGGEAAIPAFLNGGDSGHIDLPKAAAGRFAGGLFAVFVPSPREAALSDAMAVAPYDLPLPTPLEFGPAVAVAGAMIALLFKIERAGGGRLTVCRSAADVEAAMARGSMAAVLHIEGAEAIDADLSMLEVLYQAGLRSLGPVWSRNTVFGHGVPMRFPATPDIGPGLTDAGRRLVRRCNQLGVLVDLSHLNEAGFWDVAALSDAPLVATHSNAHALCTVSRNLTDRQLDAIAERDGLVGLNFATAFLRQDGRMDDDTPLDTMRRHLDHLLHRLGEDGVGLGSDFDGATIPAAIGDAGGLPALFQYLSAAGYGPDLLDKLAHRNWLRILRQTLTGGGSKQPSPGLEG